MKKCLLIILFLIPALAHAQIITTFAGNGMPGHTGDGGPATTAKILHPASGAFDIWGNYYFPENDNTVRKVNTSGIINIVAGNDTGGFSGDGGAATAAEFNLPVSVATDKIGNIYIVDELNYRIRKIDTSGIIHTIAGNGIEAFSGDGGPATAAELDGPVCVYVDLSGNIYESESGRIRKIDSIGIITTVAGNGSAGYSGDNGPATDAQISSEGIIVDNNGNIYIADFINFRVRKVNYITGIIITIAGNGTGAYSGDGGLADTTGLWPFALALDAYHNLYIDDIYNNRIRKVDTSGIISTIAGDGVAGYSGDGGPADSAKIHDPQGIVLDACGNLYIADELNNRIRKVTLNTDSVPAVFISFTPNDTVTTGVPVTYAIIITNGNAISYQWFVNGVAVPAATNSTYTYPPANNDSVRCVVICARCSGGQDTISSNTVHMVVKPLGVHAVNLSAQSVNIYPNPAYNTIIISASTPIKNVAIVNLIGQTVYSQQYNSEGVQINVANLPVGIYFVKVNGVYVQVVKE